MTDTRERALGIVANQLAVPPENVRDDSTLVDDLGADSLDVVELIMAMEEEFDVKISDDEGEELFNGNFGDLVRKIDNHLSEDAA